MGHAQKIEEILVDCLFKAGEEDQHPTAVKGEGVRGRFGFHPGRLAQHREEVKAILNEMPIEFFPEAVGGGDGHSFLQLCMDKHGEQWGDHPNVDKLICLGSALGMVAFLLPREMWEMLPGGMPYLQIDTRDKP